MPNPTTSDEQVIQLIAKGDAEAVRQLIERFGALIWSIAKRYVRPEHFVEDVSQEIITEIWKKASQFDSSKSSARTFVGLITRRRCIDWVRRQSREPDYQPLEDEQYEQPQSHSTMGINNEILTKALALLSDKEQNLFKLHFQKGMTHSEISQKIGLPLGTVKTRIRRSIIKLRSNVQQFN